MNKTKKVIHVSKPIKSRNVSAIDNDLKKYLNDPVVLKKTERAKRMNGG